MEILTAYEVASRPQITPSASCMPLNSGTPAYASSNQPNNEFPIGVVSLRSRHAQPFVQRTTLIGLKMAEADVARIGNVDELGNRFTNFRVHSPQALCEIVTVHRLSPKSD